MILYTIAPLIPPMLIVAGAAAYARCKKFDKITLLLTLLALGLYYFHFYHTSWQEFSPDARAHMDYVRYIIDNQRLPLDVYSPASRHPPLFYLTTAGLLETAAALGLANPEQFARHLAMACYVVFIFMGIGVVHLILGEISPAYYAALPIVLFWPIGVTMSGRLSCDILLFAAQAGSLFALLRWQGDKAAERLCAPFIWGGIATLGKNGGVLMIAFAVFALLQTAYIHRRNLRVLLRADLALSILFALTCTVFTLWHGWIFRSIGHYGYYWDYLGSLTSTFDVFLFMFDTAFGLTQDSFWNMWMHSLLLGGGTMPWKYPSLLLAFKLLWTAMLFYAAYGLIAARKTMTPREKSALRLFAIFVVIMICAALYLVLRSANLNYSDGRYAYPAVIAFALVHGIAMKHHRASGRMTAYRLGGMLSITFTCLAMVLFGAQYWGWLF